MNSLNRHELFNKTKHSLVGKIICLIYLIITIIGLIIGIALNELYIICIFAIGMIFSIILIIGSGLMAYFLDLVFLEYKITEEVIDNRGNGQIQGRGRENNIGGYRNITCIDGTKLILKRYDNTGVNIPEQRTNIKYKLVYLKYSKIIIDCIIIDNGNTKDKRGKRNKIN